MPTNLLIQPVPLHTLKISTNIRLHPRFSEAPVVFARQHDVDLVDEVFPETSFKKDPGSQEKAVKRKANIHLVHYGAIRLFTERHDDCDWVRNFKLNPSLLLHGEKGYMLTEDDLLVSLSILRNKVTPLLAEPLDSRYIVPGLVDTGEPTAYWSEIESEIQIPGILLPCLHDLSHPRTGPAEGATKKRIQLGNDRDDCVIEFTNTKCETSAMRSVQTDPGVSVKLILKGHALLAAFGRFGKTALIKEFRRLITFPATAVARVHQMKMLQLKGTYLPIPPEWTDRAIGKPVTHAKTIALVSQVTGISHEKFQNMDKKLRHPSESTQDRLKKDVQVEANRLTPTPVSTLFKSAVYTTREPGRRPRVTERIDPLVAAAYGQG